jgi:hypothetical protein
VVDSTKDMNARSPPVEEDDFLAVFNKPASSKPQIARVTLSKQTSPQQTEPTDNGFDDDDDPFGLGQLKVSAPATITDPRNFGDVGNDDDVLGLLAKPADSIPKSVPQPQRAPEAPTIAHPQDQAVAELVDMGFPAEKGRQALETTDSGTDVQAAVGYLLNQAHSESR